MRKKAKNLAISITFLALFMFLTNPSFSGDRSPLSIEEDDLIEMIERSGPLIFLHSQEKFFMDDPEYVLDKGSSLQWGIVENDRNYNSFETKRVMTMPTSSKTLLEDVRIIEEAIQASPDMENYKYWIHIDENTMKPGSQSRAKAFIRALPATPVTTEIQFWFFYPFNGPGRVEVCAASTMCDDNWLSQTGRHFGDWEHVSLLFSNITKELTSVYMSRHDGSETFDRDQNGVFRSSSNPKRVLQFEGSHPVIYSAVSSHAHYPKQGNKHKYKRVFSKKWGLGTASADLFDCTAPSIPFKTFEPGSYKLVSSAFPNIHVEEPGWLDFKGRWGQYEKLLDKIKFAHPKLKVYTYTDIGKGPSGPKQKKSWEGDFQPR
ncbi:MAG: Vps62-related protein [Syntrophotaleaceae bacterium]